MVVPQSQAAFNAYKSIRGSLALPDGNAKLVPVSAKNGTPYALNDGLTSIVPLWAQQNLAVGGQRRDAGAAHQPAAIHHRRGHRADQPFSRMRISRLPCRQGTRLDREALAGPAALPIRYSP